MFGAGFSAVRAVGSNKTARLNWAVPWHQDRVVAVNERSECAGFDNWTRKGGVWHCEPPIEVLARMLFLRLHLDDCDADNGAMEVIPGSHRRGRIDAREAAAIGAGADALVISAARGDICILHPLILHRSGRNQSGRPRRAIRLDLASEPLPEPLRWTGGTQD